jgi:hypothetical protein
VVQSSQPDRPVHRRRSVSAVSAHTMVPASERDVSEVPGHLRKTLLQVKIAVVAFFSA